MKSAMSRVAILYFLSFHCFSIGVSSEGTQPPTSANDSDLYDVRIDRMYEDDLDQIWKNIVHQDKIFSTYSGGDADVVVDREDADDVPQIINNTILFHPKAPGISDEQLHYQSGIGGANVDMMTKIFHELFLHKRNDEFDPVLKAKTKDGIIEKLSHYTLETQTQEFYAKAPNGSVIKGVNVIGIIPGKNRGKPGDGIVLVGAHYDTVLNSPGVDDNGSGVVALLEIARLLSPRMGHFDNTIMLVAFDLEEKGVLGSLAFVNNYLIPTELVKRKGKFVGAYILDMVMNYNPHPRSQVMPLDMIAGVPESALWLRRNHNMGNFISVWSRRAIDWPLWYSFQTAWDKSNDPNNTDHKLLNLDPPIPRNPLLISHLRFRAFFRSDHASFWSHRNREYTETLNAVLLTDMGPWRGKQRACYHEFCDDETFLTPDNLEFLKKVTDTVAGAMAKLAE